MKTKEQVREIAIKWITRRAGEFTANFKVGRYFDVLYYQYEKGFITPEQLAEKIYHA